MDGGLRALMMTLPLLLPVAGSAITGVIGLVGALASTFVVAGAGAAAFGLVAVPVFTKISDAIKAGQAEIDKLPPGLKQAATALQGVTKAYEDLVLRTQTPVGYAMAAGFDAATAALRTLDPVIISMSTALTRMGREAEQYFNSDHWRNFVDFLSDEMLPVWMNLWDIVKYLARSVMDLTVAFMPLAQWLLEAVASGMKNFSQWASTLAGDPKFHQWLELVKESLTQVWRFLVEVVKFLFNLATALAPIGNVVLQVLTAVFQGLNMIPPEMLAAIALGIAAIFTAIMLGASPPVALAIGAVTGLSLALRGLYENSEPFRAMVDRIWSDLKERFIPVFQELWQQIQDKVLPAVRELANFFESQFLPAFEKFYFAVAPILEWLMRVIGKEVVETFTAAILVITGLLQGLTGVLQIVSGILTGDWKLMWEGLKNVGEGVLNAIVGVFGLKMSEIVSYFQNDFGPNLQSDWNEYWTGLGGWLNDNFFTPTKTAWEEYLSGIETLLGLHQGTINTKWHEVWDGLRTKAVEIWDDLKLKWEGFWTGPGSVGAVLEGETPKIVTEWNTFWTDLNTKFTEATTTITESWHAFWVGLLDGMGLNGEVIVTGWNQQWLDMQVNAQLKWDEILLGWSNFWLAIGEWFTTESTKLSESWTVFWDSVFLKATQVWTDLTTKWSEFWIANIDPVLLAEIEKFNASWTTFWDGVSLKAIEIWEAIKAGWADFWGQHQATQETGQGASTQSWAQFWGNLGLNIGTFIRDSINAWVGFWGGIRTEQDGSQSQVTGSWNTFWSGLSSGAAGWWSQIQSGWQTMLNNIRSATDSVLNGIKNAFSNAVAAIRGAINGVIGSANGALGALGLPGIPMIKTGGVLTNTVIQKFASGGQLFSPVGSGFKTKGPKAIVGEGSLAYPEYVIPTDPKYRNRSMRLLQALAADLDLMESGRRTFNSDTILNPGSVLAPRRAGTGSGPTTVNDDTAILEKLDELIETINRKKLDVTVNVDKEGKTTTHGDQLALRLGRR